MNTTIQNFDLLIGNKNVPAQGNKYFDAINPSTGEVIARIADASIEDMQAAIQAARRQFDSGEWSQLSMERRGSYLKTIAQLVRENAKELAELETLGTGKTSKQTTFIDVPTCADTFEYFGSVEDPFKDRVNPVTAPVKSLTALEPRGVVGAIIPWNYPLIMAAWKIAPALAAGNCVILKPSRLGCVALMRLAQIIQQVKLPNGVVGFVTSSSHEVVNELVQSPLVDMVSFTGGTQTGREIMRLAAATTKKVALELGGKSPNIVFADCDFNAALGGTMSAIFMNQGQMCTAGSRLLLEDKMYDQFLNALVEKTKNLKIGPASDYATEFGPLISQEHRDKVLRAIEAGIKEGARILCGGKIPAIDGAANGFYLEPTILSEAKNSMTIAQEEIFGPVLSVIKFSNSDEAVQIANDSKYGLAACVWTKDLNKAEKVSRQLKTGIVWINTYGGYYNESSFGGYKQSGFGRELGTEGLLEYTQSKHVCMDETPGGMPLVSSWF